MNQRQINDEELGLQIAACEDDSKAAFFALYELYADLTLAFITGRVPPNVAPDLHQDLWLKAWDRAKTFTGGSYKAWLLTIARNRIIDFYRQRGRKKEEASEALESHASTTDETPLAEMIDQELKNVLHDCMDQLDNRTASILKQRLGGESYRVICDSLELTENAAHKIVYNAKSQLKDCVQSKTQ